MRIAFVWPWFHNLAHNYATLLEKLGHETIVFTSQKHWDPVSVSNRNFVVDQFETLGIFAYAKEISSKLKEFRPEIIFFEETLDPRFISLICQAKVPYLFSVHDPVPHDSQDRKSPLRNLVGNAQRRSAVGDLTFSLASQSVINSKFKISLLPELPLESIPVPIMTSRNHYVTFGRIRPYKNLDWLVKVWPRLHKTLRGQELHIYGKSREIFQGSGVKHFNLDFSRDSLMQVLPTYRSAIFPHTNVSQSGTLLLSHAASLSSVTTAESGFKEFQSDSAEFIDELDEDQLEDILSRRLINKSDCELGQESRLHLDKLIQDSTEDLATLVAKNFT